MELTREQRQRYNRHLVLDGFGAEAQQRLLQSKVYNAISALELQQAMKKVHLLMVVNSISISVILISMIGQNLDLKPL